MLFFDTLSRFFRSFIGRIGGFCLPIHLEAKSLAVHSLALRDRLRDGFLQRGRHSYGLARVSRWPCHLIDHFRLVELAKAGAFDPWTNTSLPSSWGRMNSDRARFLVPCRDYVEHAAARSFAISHFSGLE